MPNLTYIDIFAGAGGISLGLYNAGWKGLFAIEKSSMAFSTLKYNLIEKNSHFDWPNWLPQTSHDINEVLEKFHDNLLTLQGKVDLVAGGPPCQGFSFAGRRNHADDRNLLVNSYINFIKVVKPKYLLLENVKGFTIGFNVDNEQTIPYSTIVYKKLEELGYHLKDHLINFFNFGIPQNRIRYVLIGSLEKEIDEISEKLFIEKKDFLKEKGLFNKKTLTIKNAISDLEKKHGYYKSDEFKSFNMGKYGPARSNYQKYARKFSKKNPDSHRFVNHRKNIENRFKFLLNNCERNKDIKNEVKTKFNLKKQSIIPLAPDKPSPTLTTLPDDYIHYKEPRVLTVREYARIQSFPDWYEFKSNYTTGGLLRKDSVPRYTQIGNAVPPLFSELIGRVIGGL